MKSSCIILIFFLLGTISCSVAQESPLKTLSQIEAEHPDYKNYSKMAVSSGCFWCVEAIFEHVKGVHQAISGYAGGKKPNPTYKKTGSGASDQAETVLVYYDPKVVSFETLVKVYLNSKDNTDKKCQGPDCGSPYRSIVFYSNGMEHNTIEKVIGEFVDAKKIPLDHNNAIQQLDEFWEAEKYHQNYEKLHPEKGYIQQVSVPRLKRFMAKMPEVLITNKH